MTKQQLTRIDLKRAYEDASPDDGLRLLVERLWPRGVSREACRIDHWFKELAPSTELRRWYNHKPERWLEFRRRYVDELGNVEQGPMGNLLSFCRSQPVTFVFATRDETRSSAIVLRDYVLALIGSETSSQSS